MLEGLDIVAFRGPFIDENADHPTLEIDIRVSEPRPGWDGIHGAAVQIHGVEAIKVVLSALKAAGVEEKPHYGTAWPWPVDRLKQWYREEFDRRTKLIEAGEVNRIDWIDPGTRVAFSEVCAKAREKGIDSNVVNLRLAMGDGDAD